MITEVPTLSARDFCRGRFVNGKQSCLSGWAMRVTDHPYDENPDRHNDRDSVHKALSAQIEKSEYYVEDRHSVLHSVTPFNDDKKVPMAELARVWNDAMTDLGFDGREVNVNGKEAWGEMRS